MKEPANPENEQHRLGQLRSLEILDTEPEERFDRLTRLAKRFFDVPIALVSLVDQNRQWFKSCVGLDVSETPRNISFCGHAILGDHPFVIPDTMEDERFFDNPLVVGGPHIRFYAGVPLRYCEESKLGTLCIIDTKPRHFSQDDLETLIDLSKLVERELQAEQLATINDLTQISNRRGFSALAARALAHCRRNSVPAVLVFFDLNGFKEINDTYGHKEGDQVLIDFAQMLVHSFRAMDVCARLGGDEFAVLMAGASGAEAQRSIERLRSAVTQKYKGHAYQLSFSAGLVEISPDYEGTVDALLEQADRRMYLDKKR